MSSREPLPRNPLNSPRPVLSQGAVIPFWIVGIAWFILASAVSLWATRKVDPGSEAAGVLGGVAGLWLLCMLDLLTAGMAFQAVFPLLANRTSGDGAIEGKAEPGTSAGENGVLVLKAMFWGTLKLVCLAGILAVLWRSPSMPKWSLVLGLSTLVVVPTGAGLWWSRGEAKTESEQDWVIDSTYLHKQDDG